VYATIRNLLSGAMTSYLILTVLPACVRWLWRRSQWAWAGANALPVPSHSHRPGTACRRTASPAAVGFPDTVTIDGVTAFPHRAAHGYR
jgi:hypothetical protein